MIVVQGRELLIPDADRYIGKTPGALTETRQFKLPKVTASAIDLSGMNFYLRLQYQNDGLDTVALTKAVDGDYIILTWNITLAELKAVGPVAIQIRVTDSATVRWTSYSASLYIDRHLSIPVSYAGQLTELEQIEQDHAYMLGVVDELKNDPAYIHTAEAWAIGKRNGVDVPSTDETYHNNSKYYSEQAAASAEAWAIGKRGGVDVSPTDETYHNNSKYYSERANASAISAAGSVTTAAAEAAAAGQSATAAAGSATTAGDKATQAAQSATAAAGSATTAGTAATAAQTAQTAAETAQTAAETAQAAAEAAAQTLVIDPTLTQANQAADAKATGDAISLVKSQIHYDTIHIDANGGFYVYTED